MKKTLLALTLTVAALGSANAVTFFTSLDMLRDGSGNAVSNSTLALAVVARNEAVFPSKTLEPGGTLGLGGTAFGEEFTIVWRGDLTDGSDGALLTTINFNITEPTGTVPENSAFAFFWFPTLTISDFSLAAGTPYGYYSSIDSSQFSSTSAWNVGTNNGGSYDLNAFTTNNSGLLAPDNPLPGGLSNSSLQANFAVVPEPSVVFLFTVGMLCIVVLRRRIGSA